MANNGTIFLDEITELPLAAQVKLLRVIQDGEVEKIGRTEKIKVNVRIIAATNRKIEEEVSARRFREDLYYRLNVVPVFVPELSRRKNDIPLLFEHFTNMISLDMGKDKPLLSPDAMNIYMQYEWPGNVRELKNVVQRLFFNENRNIDAVAAKLSLGIVPKENLFRSINGVEFPAVGELMSLRNMETMMRERYFVYVRQNSSSDSEAAKKLGLAPSNFYRMAKELGLK
jgi:two-component system, NtrC family, response regulator AtoC